MSSILVGVMYCLTAWTRSFDTKLFCQGEKVGEILLSVDTIQAEVVIVNEVDEEAGSADCDTRKIDDDIFNGLGKHSDCLV